jgi:tellurite resistance protein
MLPDRIHLLSREDRFSYARLLAFMTRVDNELSVDEMAMFEQRLGNALLSPNQRKELRLALKRTPTLESCLDGMSEEAGRLALRDSVLMAAADGVVDEDEKEILKEIAAHFGLVDDAVEQLLKWTRKGLSWMDDGFVLLNGLSE